MAHTDSKLLEWGEVQEQIHHILKNSDPGEDTSVFLPHGLQPAYTFHHPHVIRCLAFYNSTKGSVVITHVDAGHRNEMFVWTMSNLSEGQVKCVRFSINSSISKLLYVPKHRVFVGFCKDIRLCIFSDVIHNCSELSSITCATTVLCMAFNELTDELITGGHGSLQAWKMSHVEIRGPLCPTTGFECDLSSTDWVRDVRIDIKNRLIIALCDERILLISSETRKQIYNFPNWHQTALTSFVFYRKLEYFITASMDGCIKVWNAVVYGQVHEFVGHFDCVTGLIVHPTDPLLLSSSKDGTVRVWRLDTFELTFRLDYGESILGMRQANQHQIFFYTKQDVKGYNFNQFHHLFTPIQSRVHLLSRIKSSIMPSRILCAAEDGGVRVISPVSGSILTIIYPMATYQVLTDLVYDISRARIYTVLTTGDVLVFSSDTNPCTPSQLWIPDIPDDSIMCITLIKLECALGKHESSTSESLIFAGSRSGQIHLIESSGVTLQAPVQAHCGTVMKLLISEGDYGKGDNRIEGADRLISSGSDKVVRIWKLDLNDKSVLLTCMMMITSPDCSCHVSMFSSSLCMTMPNFKVLVYDVGEHSSQVKDGKTNSAKRRDEQYTLFTHHKDNDHTKEITALCSCHRLGIFATTSDDGLVKIWDTQNNLVRELTFDITLRGVCFANDRGDLLVGFQNHISFVSITSYLPLTYLGSIVEEEFSSDANEEPVPFNHSLELWFDIASLLALPIELVRRKTILDALKGLRRASGKICSGEVDANYKESQPSDSQVNTDAVPEMTSVLLIPEKTKSSTGTECFKPCRKKLNVNFLPVSSQCSIESSEDDVDDTIAYGESKGYIVVQTSDSLISIDKASNIAEAPDVDDVTEASDVDDDMEDETFKWPIAPDGYIPNSVVRKLMKIPRKDAFVDSPWKLKPLPFIESPADSLAKSSKSSEDYTTHAPFEWLSSSSESNVDLEEIMSMLSDGVGGDLDVQDLLPLSSDSDSEMATPDEVLLKRRRKTATALIQLKKKMSKRGIEGGALTMAMVVEEAKQLKKEEEERKKSEIVIERKPSIPDILTLIVKMRWFSPKKITINIFSVTNALVALLDRVGDSIHGEVCKCIVDIHSGIGFNESLMDKVLSNLLKQVSSDRAPLRCNVVKTMASLGDNRNKVIMGILPLTIDLVLEVKVAAIEALKKLNGLTSKEQLMNYLANTGVIQPYVNEDRNVVKKIFSKKSAGIQKLSKFRDRNLPKNLTDLQSPVGKVDGWLATLTDEFEEEEQFEKSVNKKKKKEDKKEEMKNMKESEDMMELIPPQIKETMHHEQHNEVKQRRILPQNNQKRKPTLTSEVEKLPAIKKNEIKREKTFFVPDSCFGAEQVHKKVTPTVRRKTMHAQILEAKKYSLYLEKKRMEQTMNQRMEAHRKHYDKSLRKQRKGKQVRRFLPTSSAFYKYFFDSDCKRRGKHVYTKQPDVSMSEMNSDWMIAKCATLPRIHEQEDDNESSLRLNCQFSVVLDKGVQKHLEIESGIEDSLTCSKLSLSGGQKVGTQYSSGFFSSHEIENLKQNNTQDKTKQDVFNNSTELDRPKKLYLSSSLLQSLRKRPQIPVEEPDFIDGRQRVVYEAKTLPIERAVFPLRMTNKIMFTKEPSNTVAEWDIMRCKGKSTFGVLEMSWSLVRSKDLSESDRHRRSVREEKKRH